jgi:hypothetical protein
MTSTDAAANEGLKPGEWKALFFFLFLVVVTYRAVRGTSTKR